MFSLNCLRTWLYLVIRLFNDYFQINSNLLLNLARALHTFLIFVKISYDFFRSCIFGSWVMDYVLEQKCPFFSCPTAIYVLRKNDLSFTAAQKKKKKPNWLIIRKSTCIYFDNSLNHQFSIIASPISPLFFPKYSQRDRRNIDPLTK